MIISRPPPKKKKVIIINCPPPSPRTPSVGVAASPSLEALMVISRPPQEKKITNNRLPPPSPLKNGFERGLVFIEFNGKIIYQWRF